jgi:hypothetical protein
MSKSLATGQVSGFFQVHMHPWKEEPWNGLDFGFFIAAVAAAVAIVIAPTTTQQRKFSASNGFASEVSSRCDAVAKLQIFRHTE